MNKRFDPKKLTLTDFNPSEFQDATSKHSVAQEQDQNHLSASVNAPVPEGRTTLFLGKVRGVVSSESSTTHSGEPAPVIRVDTQNIPVSVSSDIPVSSVPLVTQVQESVLPIVVEKNFQSTSENSLNQVSDESILDITQSPQIRDELSAALHVKANRQQYKKQKEAEPDDLVAFNTRQPKWLKDKFFMVCEGKGATPSIVIRNLMKSYCGLCLVLLFISNSFSRVPLDSAYSTEQILSYFYSKTFHGKAVIPDIKASFGARHSLWQTGAQDSTDYVYADRSTTRLEAKVDIPILDMSYLKDRSKYKNELRAFVMKSLSKILAAQKAVDILETRSSALKSRLDYQRNQVALKLINKSDLFSIEDQFYTVQTQHCESQSILEQRIIDLAVIAGDDWLAAYKMILRWDSKLFN